MTRFMIGDRVRLVHTDTDYLPTGSVGTVVHVSLSGSVSVEWDGFVNGHECGGYCKRLRSGWNVMEDTIVKYNPTDGCNFEDF